MNNSEDRTRNFWQNVLKFVNIIGLLATAWLLFWAYQEGLFTSETALRDYMASLGIWAPIVFFFLQLVQTVVPVIPGAISIPIAPVIFGHVLGFILNITSIIIGSLIDFWLARRYGIRLVRILVGEDNYHKGMEWLNRGEKRFENLLVILLILPFTPGDLLCYLAGLTSMTYKKFTLTLIVGKPFNVFIYTYASLFALDFIIELF